ncbi:hypothetical protein [Arcicella lustrica]|uniref:Uncharacterized protein n=1 Tax=Arcicella lustrica TaxID=2984196 RepID=A0ABU5SMY1_9BACT|nr:hypothetical protein [Arcicella sp. DC25W]MEA5428631.1 hypothetical protein [Arcicella sp. DC25W]|eukprot:GDKJ01022601.1.p2 GENE.GDKJ01022601.1~~GDKJ01022601.1.p2  ORF type:complete len:126 (-),score=17.53 GDKJ01022601.1:7-384(-)
MKKISIIVLLAIIPTFVKSQILLKAPSDSSALSLLSPMMKDYLHSYQQKNNLKRFPQKPIGLAEIKKSVENIDNLIIVKPDLAQMSKMPVVQPTTDINHHLIIISPKEPNRITPENNLELFKKEN